MYPSLVAGVPECPQSKQRETNLNSLASFPFWLSAAPSPCFFESVSMTKWKESSVFQPKMTVQVNGTAASAGPLPNISEDESVSQMITQLKDKGTNFVLLKKTPQILELQTILKDRLARCSSLGKETHCFQNDEPLGFCVQRRSSDAASHRRRPQPSAVLGAHSDHADRLQIRRNSVQPRKLWSVFVSEWRGNGDRAATVLSEHSNWKDFDWWVAKNWI